MESSEEKKIGFVLDFNVTIWSCCSYFTVHHLVIAVFWYYRQIAINHMDMAIKKKKKIYRPSAWESKCVMICRVCQDDHLKPRRLDQEADVRIRCVCCSWCCESGRCHTSAITRLFHNTRVAPHCCQHRDEEHHLWLLPFSYGFQICFIKVEIKALSNPLKSCVLYLVCCTCISHWFSFFFKLLFVKQTISLVLRAITGVLSTTTVPCSMGLFSDHLAKPSHVNSFVWLIIEN